MLPVEKGRGRPHSNAVLLILSLLRNFNFGLSSLREFA